MSIIRGAIQANRAMQFLSGAQLWHSCYSIAQPIDARSPFSDGEKCDGTIPAAFRL
jgi:hypothetical protein